MKKPVIICVDDEKMVLDSLKTELKEKFGGHYSIETAENGEDALEIIHEIGKQNIEIQLIISDYIMPKIMGDALLKEVHFLLPKTRKILLTGQATVEGVTNSINHANLYRYIAKPWEPNDLALTVNEAIKSYIQDKQLEEQNIQLKELNHNLELKVKQRTIEIEQKNIILQEQKNELFQKNENITASISYAQRIQQALLPSEELLNAIFPESFIFYKPKDIVSGDFYWVASVNASYFEKEPDAASDNSLIIIAVADCTGHGVPGALMSMLGMSFLSEIIQNIKISEVCIKPSQILEQLRHKVISTLKQTGKQDETKDGMDIALCVVNMKEKKLHYAGAFNPLLITRDSGNGAELIEMKADRMPIGIYHSERNLFTDHELDIKKGDSIYMFSDGYIDQFGGSPVSKYKLKTFKKLLEGLKPQRMRKQGELIESTFNNWKGHLEQIDDVTVLGFKI